MNERERYLEVMHAKERLRRAEQWAAEVRFLMDRAQREVDAAKQHVDMAKFSDGGGDDVLP